MLLGNHLLLIVNKQIKAYKLPKEWQGLEGKCTNYTVLIENKTATKWLERESKETIEDKEHYTCKDYH